MKKIIRTGFILVLSTLFYFNTSAQLTTLPNGGNKKASVSERIGITDVSINYHRPGVKGREGKIWGSLVPVGYADLGFGNTKEAPWRAGANENTTITFSNDVKIDGQPLAAGTYGLFIAYDPNESTLIFSKNSSSWGSFYYSPKEDALRVKVKPVALDKSVEWLRYEFSNQKENSATVTLEWEKLSFPFNVEVDYVNTQLESFRHELRSDKGFTWFAWSQAAQWCVQHNTNLDEALLWADSATSQNFGGDASFQALSTKAMVLDKMGKTADAGEIMKKAMGFGNVLEVHQYARQLIAQKKAKEALDAFQLNYNKHPNEFTTNMGMARGLSATGNYKKSLEYAQKALAQAPDKINKDNIEKSIEKLKEGKDIN